MKDMKIGKGRKSINTYIKKIKVEKQCANPSCKNKYLTNRNAQYCSSQCHRKVNGRKETDARYRTKKSTTVLIKANK